MYLCLLDVKLQFHALSRERIYMKFIMTCLCFKQIFRLILSKFRFESILQSSSACHTKCDEDNILHVATLSKATQLFLLIVNKIREI